MPLFIKNAGVFGAAAVKGDVSAHEGGLIKTVKQAYAKDAGVWYPMWSDLPFFRYGYAPFSGAGLDQAAGFATSQAFMDNYLTNIFANNDDGNTINASTAFQADLTLYLYVAWPTVLNDIAILNTNLGATEIWPYSQETGAYFADGPSTPIEVPYDDGAGSIQWNVLRNDFPGAYDTNPTGYSFSFPSRP